ncbi:MAG TPA: 5-formyltetrahydrofolate cyclo-ligase [Vicinamibacteria bacterium]|jgi:5-formyltetrahydrofolate cyclo-ligase|nr:5-formyltetrahydrofolate cyclo-ligase [Vicinamibacteria bacterium]
MKATAVDPAKQRLREQIWTRLTRRGVAVFPGARGRIPNFKGAAEAARLLAETPEWRRARTLKCNPDAPQRPVRLRALREGKLVYMAVPRLRQARCFWRLDPKRIADLGRAATIGGAARAGEAVRPAELPHVDMVVAGSVAVDRRGGRLGKGGGYSDLEFALGREVGAIDRRTVVATTVHDLQVLDDDVPVTAHDFFLDLIVTPSTVLRPPRRRRQPRGVLADQLTPEQRRELPPLREAL